MWVLGECSMIEYNKLVRDKIPQIMYNNNEKPITRILDDTEYCKYLDLKLKEEVEEYIESNQLEELADILEVIFAIAESKNCPVNQLMQIFQNKHNERGGFKNKIFLIGKE